jgi:outer membrane immunogenic protein
MSAFWKEAGMSGRTIMKPIAVAMFCLIVAVSEAVAADLPPAPPPPPRAPAAYIPAPPPPFNWTGLYLGGNLGMGWNHGNIQDAAGLFSWGLDNNTTFGGGAQVGGNYQIGSFVLGVEADFDWFSNNNNSGGGTVVNGVVLQGSNNGRWLTTVTGRAGFAADRVLFYAKGGGAYVGSDNFTLLNVPTGQTASFNNSSTNTGWTVGAGVEWAFWNNFTARVEYDYVGLSNYSVTIPASFPAPAAGDVLSTSNRQIQMVMFGLNYLFNGF